MIDALMSSLSSLPPWIGTMLLAALPVTELRLAIPIAIREWLMNPYNAYLAAVIGNIIPFFPLYFGLDWLRDQLEKHSPFFTRLLDKFVLRAKTRVEEKYERYGAFALFLFTALPLPFTGLWTATLAAVALKVKAKYAMLGIFTGVLTAGVIVTLLSLSPEVLF